MASYLYYALAREQCYKYHKILIPFMVYFHFPYLQNKDNYECILILGSIH